MNPLRRLGDRARVQVSLKLGRCSRCMRASLLGAFGSVVLVLGLAFAGLHPLLMAGAAVVAVSFCSLVLAHAVAYVYHGTHPTPISVSTPCCGQAKPEQRLLVQVQRRPLLQVLTSLPAAFGLTQLVRVPGVAAQPAGTVRVTKTFHKPLTCAPCAGTCDFYAYFTYDYIPQANGKIQVTRFDMTWDQRQSGACVPSIDRGSGEFDFQCATDSKPCKLTGGNIWACPCDTKVLFVPLGQSTQADCTCPNQKNRVPYAQGVCGAPFLVEKSCNFQWIDVNFYHKVTCSCPEGGITRGELVVVAQYRNGEIRFGGDVEN